MKSLKMFSVVAVGCFLMVLHSSCMSVKDGQVLQDDIFATQKRLLDLENQLQNESSQVQVEGQHQRQRMASTSNRLEEMESRLVRLDGEIGVLRMGVITGELPNQGTASDSVAKSLARFESRVDVLEERQLEILNILKKKTDKENKSKRKPMVSLAQIKKAFKDKRFTHVAEDYHVVIKKIRPEKKQDLADLSYLYAESLYKLGDIRKAALQLREHIKNFKESSHLAEVTLRLGDSFRLLGDSKAARIFYEEVVEKYAKSEASEKAKDKLNDLF